MSTDQQHNFGQRGTIFLPRHLSLDKISFGLESQRRTFNHGDQLGTGTLCHRIPSSEGGGGTGGTVCFIRGWLADARLPCTWLQACTLPSRARSLPRSDGTIQRGDSHLRACCDFLRTLLRWKRWLQGSWKVRSVGARQAPTASSSHSKCQARPS